MCRALDRLYDLYSFNVIPPIGRAVTGDAEAYRYLVESIRKFPRPREIRRHDARRGLAPRLVPGADRRRGGAALRLAAVSAMHRTAASFTCPRLQGEVDRAEAGREGGIDER